MLLYLDMFSLVVEAYAQAPKAILMQHAMAIMMRVQILMMMYTLPMVMVVMR
jgi:hypothetical protein